MTKKAIEKLEWGRRFRHVDHQFEELLIEQYKIRITQTDASQHSALHNAINNVIKNIAEKKAIAEWVRNGDPSCDVAKEVLKIIASLDEENSKADDEEGSKAEAKVEFEESMAMPMEKDSDIDSSDLSSLPMGNAQKCIRIAFDLLKIGESLSVVDFAKSQQYLNSSILVFQQVNALLTVKSSRLEEKSEEHIKVLAYRDQIIALAKAKATFLLNPSQRIDHFTKEQLQERRNVIDNALRYVAVVDESDVVLQGLNEEREKLDVALLSEPLAAQENAVVAPPAQSGHVVYVSRFYKPVDVSKSRSSSSAHTHHGHKKGY